MISREELNQILIECGADVFGVASIDKFDNAPERFHPRDIFEQCESVIVIAKKIPPFNILNNNKITRTNIGRIVLLEIDNICFRVSCILDKYGIGTVMIPADDPCGFWDDDRKHGRGILSLKHAAFLAGIGVIGKNTLLTSVYYGNLIDLGAILIDKKFDSDEPENYTICNSNCNLCIENCPQKALDGITVNQSLCRNFAYVKNDLGLSISNCNICRTICPYCLGTKRIY
jgi:epoxyqueuosine reductase